MKRFHLTLGLLMIAVMAVGGAGFPRGAAAATPDARSLLRQSIATMTQSVHSAQATGKSALFSQDQKAGYTVTGSCARSGTRITVMVHTKGTTTGDTKPQALNEEVGLIWSRSPGWVALSKRTPGKAWQFIDAFDSEGAAMVTPACPLIVARQLQLQPPTGLAVTGSTTINGEPAWPLRGWVAGQSIQLFIGKSSHRLLRLIVPPNVSGARTQITTITYRSFNTPVTIKLPPAKPMAGRAFHVAVRLSDGQVMLLGGISEAAGNRMVLNGWVDLYNPVTGAWSRAADPPSVPLVVSASTVGNGQVLVPAYFYPATAGPQLFDPATNSWSTARPMRVTRSVFLSVVLKDGRLLVAGGFTMLSDPEISAEIYDPDAGTWSEAGSTVGPLWTGQFGAQAVLMRDGRVLVAGSHPLGNIFAQIFDPAEGTWSRIPEPDKLVAVTSLWGLPGGTVLAVGATTVQESEPAGPAAMIYDPTGNTWSDAGPIPVTSTSPASVLLDDGTLLVSGGYETGGSGGEGNRPVATVWRFNPTSKEWTRTGSMKEPRRGHTLTLLKSGKVLAAGGTSTMGAQGQVALSTRAELYDPSTGEWSYTGDLK